MKKIFFSLFFVNSSICFADTQSEIIRWMQSSIKNNDFIKIIPEINTLMKNSYVLLTDKNDPCKTNLIDSGFIKIFDNKNKDLNIEEKYETRYFIDFKYLNPDGIKIEENKNKYFSLIIPSSFNKQITSLLKNNDGEKYEKVSEFSINFNDSEDIQKLSNAFKRSITMCGGIPDPF